VDDGVGKFMGQQRVEMGAGLGGIALMHMLATEQVLGGQLQASLQGGLHRA
jgi:hypothetical protein